MADKPLPELYFATVRAIGADIDHSIGVLEKNLGNAGYEPERIRLSKLFEGVPMLQMLVTDDGTLDEYEIRNRLMDAGDALRTRIDTTAVAKLGLMAICDRRQAVHERARKKGRRGVAFIIQSLMHETEVRFLRAVLGTHFFVLSLFSREDHRLENLVLDLGARPGQHTVDESRFRNLAKDLMVRDKGQKPKYRSPLASKAELQRLSIEKTFHEGDVFIDIDKKRAADRQIRRFVKLIFADPYATTTEDEAAMGHAFTALRESSSVARRVGAALLVDGVLVTVGRNDLPQAGGGQFRQPAGDGAHDDLAVEPTASNLERADVLRDSLTRLFTSEQWIELLQVHGVTNLGPLSDEALDDILAKTLETQAAKDSRIFDLIEFNPTVHAEMSAITAAARKGIPLYNATLYTTTFPCHECTRHIIATGIRRVVYLEPYTKSRAEELFSGQIILSERRGTGKVERSKVLYEPFMGVAPRRHWDLFSWVERGKTLDEIRSWTLNADRKLRFTIEPEVPPALGTMREIWRQQACGLAVDEFRSRIQTVTLADSSL